MTANTPKKQQFWDTEKKRVLFSKYHFPLLCCQLENTKLDVPLLWLSRAFLRPHLLHLLPWEILFLCCKYENAVINTSQHMLIRQCAKSTNMIYKYKYKKTNTSKQNERIYLLWGIIILHLNCLIILCLIISHLCFSSEIANFHKSTFFINC